MRPPARRSGLGARSLRRHSRALPMPALTPACPRRTARTNTFAVRGSHTQLSVPEPDIPTQARRRSFRPRRPHSGDHRCRQYRRRGPRQAQPMGARPRSREQQNHGSFENQGKTLNARFVCGRHQISPPSPGKSSATSPGERRAASGERRAASGERRAIIFVSPLPSGHRRTAVATVTMTAGPSKARLGAERPSTARSEGLGELPTG